MKPGRKPKPEALRDLEGTGSHHAKPAPGPRPAGVATMPTGLHDIAKRLWRRRAPELERLGVLTSVDAEAFACLCQVYARWRVAEKRLDVAQIAVKEVGGKGYLQVSPHVAMARQYHADFLKAAAAFGMTPSARVGMSVKPPLDEDDLDKRIRERHEQRKAARDAAAKEER